MVPKPDSSFRPVIDYRKLNRKVVLESVPLPHIDFAFSYFKGARVYPTFDLKMAYYQVPLAEESKHLTAFSTDFNLYEFNRVPFGLSTGASVLTILMDNLFSDIKYKFVYNYLDDLVIFS